MTQATRVRVQILLAIRKSLASRDVVSFVRRYDRSPSLVVTQDHRERTYGFVKACVEFRSMLTADCLRFAYAASRDFVDRMAILFIVLTDGGQPLSTFTAPTLPEPANSSLSANLPLNVATPTVATVTRPNYLLQSLAPSSSWKRQIESADDSVPTKRVAN